MVAKKTAAVSNGLNTKQQQRAAAFVVAPHFHWLLLPDNNHDSGEGGWFVIIHNNAGGCVPGGDRGDQYMCGGECDGILDVGCQVVGVSFVGIYYNMVTCVRGRRLGGGGRVGGERGGNNIAYKTIPSFSVSSHCTTKTKATTIMVMELMIQSLSRWYRNNKTVETWTIRPPEEYSPSHLSACGPFRVSSGFSSCQPLVLCHCIP